jgi:iron complex transport system ATP-binding protein
MLEVQNLTLTYQNQAVLNDISLCVRSGEFTAIIGENGCGKSTLLRCIAGIHSQHSGTMALNQICLSRWQTVALAKQRAFVAQSNPVYFAFLTENLLLLARANQDETTNQSTALICSVAEQLAISHLFGRDVRTLSGGERQRVFIAKALLQLLPSAQQRQAEHHLQHKLLLLDEPTSALDFRFQKATMDVLKDYCEQGLAVICVSHDINLVLPYADKVVLLAKGRCLAEGQVSEVITQDNLSACYGVTPNIIPQSGTVPFITH